MVRLTSAINSITDPNHRTVIETDTVNQIVETRRQIHRYNPYAQTDENAEILQDFSIATDPQAVQIHSHPANKAIENYLLTLLNNYLGSEYTILDMKESKLQYINPPPDTTIYLRNARLTAKDHVRYKDHLVQTLFANLTKIVFAHDLLHFYAPEDIYEAFVTNPACEHMFATVVIPPECKLELPSLVPSLYQLRYFSRGGRKYFVYIPDGHGAGAYEQPLSCTWWLDTGKIVGPELTLSITKLETFGAHHLIQISRGDFVAPQQNHFNRTHLVEIPRVYVEELGIRHPYFPKKIVKQTIMYALSLKEVTIRDIDAKLRQLIPSSLLEDLDLQAMRAVVDIIYVISSLHRRPDLVPQVGVSFAGKFWNKTLGYYVKNIKHFFSTDTFKDLIRLLELPELSLDTDLKVYRMENRFAYAPVMFQYKMLKEQYQWRKRAQVMREYLQEPSEKLPIQLRKREGFSKQGPAKPAQDMPQTPPPKYVEPEISCRPVSYLDDHLPFFARRYLEGLSLPAWMWPILERLDLPLRMVQKDPKGNIIMPLEKNPNAYTHLRQELRHNFSGETREIIEGIDRIAKQQSRHWYKFSPDRKRGKHYTSDVKNKREGLLWKTEGVDCKKIDEVVSSKVNKRTVQLLCISGRGGSGKSRALQELLKQHPNAMNSIITVVPTQRLRSDWVDKTEPEFDAAVKTFEVPFKQAMAPILLVDDATKVPRGWLEALLRYRTGISHVICTFDDKQSTHFPSHAEAACRGDADSGELLMRYTDYSFNFTWRNPLNIANDLGVYGLRGTWARVTMRGQPSTSMPILTPSMKHANTLNELDHNSYTYAGCQGVTFEGPYQINLNHDTPLCGRQTMYTSLSRAGSDIVFVNSYSNSQQFQQKLDRTPYLKTLLKRVREQPVMELPPRAAPPTEPDPPRTHFPVETTDHIYGAEFDAMPEKQEREIFTERGHTNCVQGETEIEQAVPRQQAKDEALLEETYKGRIENEKTPDANQQRFDGGCSKKVGQLLFESLRDLMGLPNDPQPFDEDLWVACEEEWEANFLSKTPAQLFNGKDRQDPDWDDLEWEAIEHMINFVCSLGNSKCKDFLKSQDVLKEEKFAKEKIKKGQTILALKQSLVAITGTAMRYTERVIERFTPSNIYFHARKTPADLKRFVLGDENHKGWDFGTKSRCNDFDNFDNLQNEGVLHFEEMMQTWVGVPKAVLVFRIHTKLHTYVRGRLIKVKRFSGESETLGMNGYYNAAVHNLIYRIPKGTLMCFTGDDSTINRQLVEKRSWAAIKSLFKISWKPEDLTFPGFVGWLFTPAGPIKSPKKLLNALKYKEAKGPRDLLLALRSYFNDFLTGYELGERLFDILTPEQAACHQELTRFFVKHGFNPAQKGSDRYPDIEGQISKLHRRIIKREGRIPEESKYAIGHRQVEFDYDVPHCLKPARLSVPRIVGTAAPRAAITKVDATWEPPLSELAIDRL